MKNIFGKTMLIMILMIMLSTPQIMAQSDIPSRPIGMQLTEHELYITRTFVNQRIEPRLLNGFTVGEASAIFLYTCIMFEDLELDIDVMLIKMPSSMADMIITYYNNIVFSLSVTDREPTNFLNL